MRKQVFWIVLMVSFLAALLPFASTSPDGLERVAETFGIEGVFPLWSGLMPDYSLETVGNSYVSTLIAGVFGIVIVLLSSLVLGKALSRKSNNIPENRI